MSQADLYFYKSFVVAILISEAAAMIIYFTHTWVRNGYVGKDNQLDLMETGAYYKHLLGFWVLILATGMILTPPITKYIFPTETWWFLGTVFSIVMGAEVYTEVRKSVGKFKSSHNAKDS